MNRSKGDRGRYPGFHIRFRGFDRTEVVAALSKLASENGEARREVNRLGAEIERLQGTVADHMGTERHVQRALIAATKTADDIRERAEEEARRTLMEATEEARRIISEAQAAGEMAVQRLSDQTRSL